MALVKAVFDHDINKIKELIKAGHSVNQTDRNGDTALYAAVNWNYIDIVEYLLQQPDIDINRRNSRGETILLYSMHTCARYSIIPIKLIEAGADINVTDRYNRSPLQYAIERNLDLASILIQKGADINATFDSITLLHFAVSNSNYEQAVMLLYYGADTDVVTKEGKTPFMLALERRNVEIQKLLLEYEVDLNRTDETGLNILQTAVAAKSPLILDLIEKGADVNYTTEYINTHVLQYSLIYWKDNSLFKAIWSRYNYHIVYNDKTHRPLIFAFDETYFLSVDHWLECLTIVFHSNVIHDIIQDYRCVCEPPNELPDFFQREQLCELLILMFADRKLSENDLYPFICIALSQGVNVYFSDIIAIYICYGYNKTLKFFLQFNIEMNKAFTIYLIYPTLPIFICDVTKDPKTELSNVRLPKSSLSVKFMNDLLDMFTPPLEFVNRLEEFLKENPELEEHFAGICERLKRFSVASLRELSRDALKKAICTKLNKTNCLEFYTALKKLPIPTLVKRMIAYEVPVNVS